MPAPNFAGLKALEAKVASFNTLPKFKPTISNFINNTTSGVKGDPGAQARSVISGESQQGQSTQQVSNYTSNLKNIGNWGRQNTNQVRASNIAKKAAKAAEVAQQAKLRAVQQSSGKAQGRVSTGKVSTVSAAYSGPISGARSHLVKQAQSLLGTPYAWGGGGYGNRSSRGTGKGTQNVIGVDCSGLTSYVYGTIGVKLARQSDAQLRTAGYKTSVNNLQPGDLVGWAKGGHVAMYIGNGQIIESPKPGATVRTRTLSSYDFNGGVFGVRVKLPGE